MTDADNKQLLAMIDARSSSGTAMTRSEIEVEVTRLVQRRYPGRRLGKCWLARWIKEHVRAGELSVSSGRTMEVSRARAPTTPVGVVACHRRREFHVVKSVMCRW
jgi:hypothetical protein